MANRNFLSNKLYQLEAYPVLLSCNFVVTPTNGLGITSLKGGGVRNVFMHTSTTPASNNGYTNPNPEDGVIAVQLQDNYSKFLSGFNATVSYLDGSSQTSTTAGRASVITALGTATLAQWQAKGLPVGVTPAVGVCFIATASGAIGGSAAVQRPLWSGISAIEACSNLNNSISSANSPVNGGAWLYFQTLGPSFTAGAYTPAGTVAAPVLTMDSYTPTGTVAAGVIPVTAGTAGDAVTNNAGVLESTGGQDLTVNEQAFTGDAAVLTGTNSAPAFTGTAASLSGTVSLGRVAPVAGSLISLSFYLSNSSVTVNGQ